MGALVKQDVIVYQWASEPYLQFLKLKACWLPERPKFYKLIHDGINVKKIFLGYQNEAVLVELEDSRVKDIRTHRAFREKVSMNWKSRWRDFSQIPFSKGKTEEVKNWALNQATVSRKLLAATTLKRPKHHHLESYFLATFDRVTFVTDNCGAPLTGKGVAGWGDGVLWEAPVKQLILRHGEYVIGVSGKIVEVNDWTSSKCLHKINFSDDGKLDVLSNRLGGLIIKFEQKRKRPHIYWLKEKSRPRINRKEDIIKPLKSPTNAPPTLKNETDDSGTNSLSLPAYVANPSLHLDTSEPFQESSLQSSAPSNSEPSPMKLTQVENNPPALRTDQRLESKTAELVSIPTQRRTISRKNISTVSTDEYIRMRNQLASGQHGAAAILTRPIINAYNQPFGSPTYDRQRSQPQSHRFMPPSYAKDSSNHSLPSDPQVLLNQPSNLSAMGALPSQRHPTLDHRPPGPYYNIPPSNRPFGVASGSSNLCPFSS